MDADLQHPPELIGEFVRQWRAGFDIVYGQRIDRNADSLVHRWAARAFYAAFHKLSGTTLRPKAPAISACSTARPSMP